MQKINSRSPVSKPEGGYCLIPVTRLYAAWWLYRQGELQFRDVRVYLGLEEMRARRCTLNAGRTARFTLAELERLCSAGSIRSIRASLRRLKHVKLSTWNAASIQFHEDTFTSTRGDFVESLRRITNHRRRIPVPRRTLRWLASASRPVLVATVLGHLLRCVYLRGCQLAAEGTVSATWIETTFGVDRRNVKRAKATLRELKWFAEKPSHHWHRQRYGQSVAVNLNWSQGSQREAGRSTHLPPRSAQTSTESPPPDSDRELPKEVRNQERSCATGVRELKGQSTQPRLRHVVPADLAEPSRTAELFHQAMQRGLVKDSSMDRLQFFAAARRAMRLGRNPGAFFMTILKRKLWTYISGAEEEWARTELAKMPDFLYRSDGRSRKRTRPPRARGSESQEAVQDPMAIRELVRQSLATAPAAADWAPETFFPSHLVLDEFPQRSETGSRRGTRVFAGRRP